MRENHSAVTQCIITPRLKPAEGDEASDKPIKPKLQCGMGTLYRTGPDQYMSHHPAQLQPNIDDNEFLSVTSSSIEPNPVCRGNSRGTGTAHIPLSPVTSLYSALAD